MKRLASSSARSLSEPYLVFDFVDSADVPQHLVFADPVEVITTTSLADVRSCLREVEQAKNKGLYAAGYVSYEAAPAMDASLNVRADSLLPLIWFGLFRTPSDPRAKQLEAFQLSAWQPSIKRATYDDNIARVGEAIGRGDTYQVNYGFRLRAEFAGDDYAFYRRLVQAQRAPYCAYLNLGRYRILSASPELFFRRHGSLITARPMKGTTRRGRWADEDNALAAELYQSEKNRAENVMIVDLVRNDLGHVAEIGSVRVRKLFELERYPTLWQMTSTIDATLRPGSTIEDLFVALFPSGSITGAPKISTMKIIANLEDSPRNAYCGAIGFVKPNGEAAFNVAIRTVVIDSELGMAEYGVGGGVTWDSTSADEYQEALNKAAVLVEPCAEFELLETMRLENGKYALLERHLERLQSSAGYFDFSLSLQHVRAELAANAERLGTEAQRVRLLVSKDGVLRIENAALEVSHSASLAVALASRPVSRDDLFLHHKTTQRQIFAELKAEFPDSDDVLLWNEEEEVTEFCTGNLVAKLNGVLVTPPRESGLLAGALRAQLLADGEIQERVLPLSELYSATDLWLINSVRGWIPVSLADTKRATSR